MMNVFKLLVMVILALATLSAGYAQQSTTPSGPTIDTELAQKLFRRGNTYSNLERYDEAIDEYKQAIIADPNFGDALRNLANTYYYLERYAEAKPLLARYIEITNEPTTAYIASVSTLGELERKDGNYNGSVKYDLMSIEFDPSNDSQVHIMGNTYNNAGEADKAIQIYQAGIKAQPGNAFFYRTLGRLLEQEGRLEEALAEYEEAMEKNPDSDFYANLVETTRARLGLN